MQIPALHHRCGLLPAADETESIHTLCGIGIRRCLTALHRLECGFPVPAFIASCRTSDDETDFLLLAHRCRNRPRRCCRYDRCLCTTRFLFTADAVGMCRIDGKPEDAGEGSRDGEDQCARAMHGCGCEGYLYYIIIYKYVKYDK